MCYDFISYSICTESSYQAFFLCEIQSRPLTQNAEKMSFGHLWNEFWHFVKWVFGFFQADLVHFYKKYWSFHQISQAKWKNMSNFSVFWLNFFTYEDKLSKTNKKARFFYFETLVSLLVKWVLPSVKWVLPSVKWVSAILGEMSFGQNAQKKSLVWTTCAKFWKTK